MRNIKMTIVNLSPLFKEAHGKLGDFVFWRGPNGKTIVSQAPRASDPKAKKAQKDQQRKLMQSAHDYAYAAMANPESKAYYEKNAIKGKEGRLSYGPLRVYEAPYESREIMQDPGSKTARRTCAGLFCPT
jgi:hypothetical protein